MNAVMGLRDQSETEDEARLSLTSGDSLDLKVTAHRITVDGENLSVVTLTDIAHEKRRQTLERLFFHDVLNTAGAIQGITGLLRDTDDDLIQDAAARYQPLANSAHIRLEVVEIAEHELIDTDPALTGRILGNLVKNAIEASGPGMTVTVGASAGMHQVEFTVHSLTPMSQETQRQVFQGSFSTKGSGRGLGTYSVRLFTERYLGGHVSFLSSAESGTTFRVTLPRV